ncbi:MAG: septum formation protein Maf [Clostridia bacterium]|nr:septum formation protein Maf [Clostridia bacterium]
MRVILASKSPRRKELLGKLFENFEIKVSRVNEELDDGVNVVSGVEILSVRKGAEIALENPDALVISSDTLVELDGAALGKPSDKTEAVKMLKSLSGRGHNVHTGVAVHYNGKLFSGVATSTVYFRELSDAEIYEYVESGAPMDKAGAYGIQGEAGKFVLRYDGDFDTIVGLSLRLTKELVEKATE